jgi:uncharacterized protein YdaU (DUF1376 family)
MAKKKQKQPYIPFYTGDHIKDTRALTLEAKGAWMDLVLFMWINESRGILEGNMADFARMVGTSETHFVAVLNELCRKNICDVYGDQTKIFKIACRRMVREAEISDIRRDAVNNRYKEATNEPTKPHTKSLQNPDNDNEDDNESGFKYELKESAKKSETFTVDVPQGTIHELKAEIFEGIFSDQRFVTDLQCVHPGKDLKQAWEECWIYHSQKPSPPEQLWEWKQKLSSWLTIKRKDNAKQSTTGNRNTDHIAGLAADHARRYGADGTGNKN